MTPLTRWSLVSFALCLLAAAAGCGSPPAPPTAAEEEQTRIAAELAKLAPADSAAATKQRLCPVTDKPLGSMGAPEKVDVAGTPVWICCAGCKTELVSNADKYLPKLQR